MPNLTELAADILSYIQSMTDPNTGHLFFDIGVPALEIEGDLSVINSATDGKTVLSTSDINLDMLLSDAVDDILGDDHDTLTDVVDAIEAITFSGDVAIVNSTTSQKTKIKTTPDNPPNLDAAISTIITAITGLGTITADFTEVPVVNYVHNNITTPLLVSTALDSVVVEDALSTVDANIALILNQKANYIASKEAPSTSGYTGTVTVPITTAAALPAQACSEVTIQAYSGNTQNILFGFYSNECFMEMAAGKDFTIPVANLNMLYVVSSGNSTQTLHWLART